MKSVRTKEFHELFAQLPRDVQKQAIDAYRIFKENPYHPSLHFKCINKEKSRYSVRVSKSYRVVGTWKGDTILLERMQIMITSCDRLMAHEGLHFV